MDAWYRESIEGIAHALDVDTERGLSAQDVTERRKRYGGNTLPRGKETHWWELLISQFKNPLVFILLIAAALTWWLDEPLDTAVILLAVGVNVLIGFWQESRSTKIFEELQKIVTVEATALRDGVFVAVDAELLVPGDVILLRSGMKVPADARLASARSLEVNEALLTGESNAVRKNAAILSGTVPLADRTNMIHLGTVVEKGEGTAIVVATGVSTELGSIAKLTTSVRDEKTPLQERLGRLSRTISIFVLVSAVLILAVGSYEGKAFVEMFTVAVAVAVAAIPEGLPAALSVVLAVASQKILRRKGLVKNLIGAETLGSTEVICTDKTGTLTEGEMAVEAVIGTDDVRLATRALALANEAVLEEHDTVRGEATDRAKLEYFLKNGGNFSALLKELPRCALLPFDDEVKYIASFHTSSSGPAMLFVTGAPEDLLRRSLDSPERKVEMKRLVEEGARNGKRMIGVAVRELKGQTLTCESDEALRPLVSDLSFVGLATLRDPVRSDAGEAVATARGAGIRIIMMTGDHRLTAVSVARELGFDLEGDAVMEGVELEALSDDALKARIDHISVLARVTPAHKMRVIDALQARGYSVAMTGDGVNDAPALRAADIGIALGSGTDVTKEAADLVLLDNSFSTITAAIRQGRVAFDNIRKVTIYLLSNSFTELILVLASLVLRVPLPITAVQILWANLVEDGLPNFALAFEPGEEDVMRRKPLKRRGNIIDRQGFTLIYIVGIVTDFMLLGIFLTLYRFSNMPLEEIRTIIFAALSTDSLLYVFSIKSLHRSLFKTNPFNNTYLLAAVSIGLVMILASLYVPILNRLIETVPLPFPVLLFVFALGGLKICIIEFAKMFFRGKIGARADIARPVPAV